MATVPKKEVVEHIKSHVKYPATKKQLVEACNKMADVPKTDKEWFQKNLSEGTYKTPDEVLKALKLKTK